MSLSIYEKDQNKTCRKELLRQRSTETKGKVLNIVWRNLDAVDAGILVLASRRFGQCWDTFEIRKGLGRRESVFIDKVSNSGELWSLCCSDYHMNHSVNLSATTSKVVIRLSSIRGVSLLSLEDQEMRIIWINESIRISWFILQRRNLPIGDASYSQSDLLKDP